MPDIAICLHAHQPYRLRRFKVFDIGRGTDYFDDELNRMILQRVTTRCYLPASRILAEQVLRADTGFRVGLSISGALLEQLAAHVPQALEIFRAAVATGRVELLGGTYHESLSALVHPGEFAEQVSLHLAATELWFHQRPSTFRNTGLIYSDEVGSEIARLGFEAAILEGAPRALGGRSPNHVYASTSGLKLLPRNRRLSEDIGHRFTQGGDGRPLRADTFADWVAGSEGTSIVLDLDLESFGEHHSRETGIFEFLRRLPDALARRGIATVLPSTLAARPPAGFLAVSDPVSASDGGRELGGLFGNRLQRAAQARLYGCRAEVSVADEPELVERWRRLSSSDHYFYMCTESPNGPGLSPYEDPYTAFINYMNVIEDLERAARAACSPRVPRRHPARKRRPARSRLAAPARESDVSVEAR